MDRDNLHVIFKLHNKFFEGAFTSNGRFDPCVVRGIFSFVQFPVLYFDMGHDVDSRYIGVRCVSIPKGFVVYLIDMILDYLIDCCVDSVPFRKLTDTLFLCAVD